SGSAASTPALRAKGSSKTLHQAFRAYKKYLEREYYRPELEQLSPWGKTQVRQVENLLKHHQNVLLANLDANAVEELVGYWRRRPIKKGTTEPMKAKSSANYLATLGRFFRWL